MIRICEVCGEEFDDYKKVNKHVCRNEKCLSLHKKWNKTPNCQCKICGKKFYIKPSHLDKEGTTCGMECNKIMKAKVMSGSGNHQFGLTGENNASWKGGSFIKHGYRYLYMPNHPMSKDKYIQEHRYIAEQYLLTKLNSICIDGEYYLSGDYEVHHLDMDKLNNDVNNLIVLTKSQHTYLHNITIKRKEKHSHTNSTHSDLITTNNKAIYKEETCSILNINNN